jgi:hypothetical protein
MRYGLTIAGVIVLGTIGIMTLRGATADSDSSRSTSEDAKINVIDMIQGIETAEKVTIVLLPPDASFRGKVTEATLWQLGCPFFADNPSLIRALIDILRDADLNIVEPTEPGWMNEPREGIFLELANGSKPNFLFTINFINQGVRGYFYRGTPVWGNSTKSYLIAKSSLPNELIAWALHSGASIARKDVQPKDLQRVERACEYFAKSRGESK